MTLTNEDLLAISQVVDTRLEKRLKPIEKDIKELKDDVAGLKVDIIVLNDKVQSLDDKVQSLDDKVQSLDDKVQSLDDKVQSLEAGLHNVRLFQENIILPRLNTIESCYTDTYHRYQRDCDRMETVFDDVDLLKKVVAEHSEKLQKLA